MGVNYCNREIKKKMYLRKIEIKNYRLWKEATIELEQGSTVIVGKNNTGKTSFIDIIQRIIKNAKISFNDYPLNERKSLYENIKNYLDETITFEELAEAFSLPSVLFYIDYSFVQNIVQIYEIILRHGKRPSKFICFYKVCVESICKCNISSISSLF